jgi:hypothetical protein
MSEHEEVQAVEPVARRNWARFAGRAIQWVETYALDGDPKLGPMLTTVYTADRLAVDATVIMEATLLVHGVAQASVAVPVAGLQDWRWPRLFAWADQALAGVEAAERDRVALLVPQAVVASTPVAPQARARRKTAKAAGTKAAVVADKPIKAKRARKAPTKETGHG